MSSASARPRTPLLRPSASSVATGPGVHSMTSALSGNCRSHGWPTSMSARAPCIGLKGLAGREKLKALRINAEAGKCLDGQSNMLPLIEGGDGEPMG